MAPRHKQNKETYDRNLQKANRPMCLPYKNYKKQIQPPKAPKSDCKCRLNCSQNISDEDRAALQILPGFGLQQTEGFYTEERHSKSSRKSLSES